MVVVVVVSSSSSRRSSSNRGSRSRSSSVLPYRLIENIKASLVLSVSVWRKCGGERRKNKQKLIVLKTQTKRVILRSKLMYNQTDTGGTSAEAKIKAGDE